MVLGIQDAKGMSETQPFSSFGMDSLMTTEIQQLLGREYGIPLNVSEVQDLKLAKLRELAK